MDGELLGADDIPSVAKDPANAVALEVMHCAETSKGTAVFRLRDHLERFLTMVEDAGVEDYPYSLGKLFQAVHRVICANGCLRCRVQIQLVWESPRGSASKPFTLISMLRGEGHRTSAMQTGVKASFSALQDNPEVFWVQQGVLYAAESGSRLGSIARGSLLTLAADAGMRVVQEPLTGEKLLGAEEVFQTHPPIDVLPVIEIDGQPIASGKPGSLTLALRESLEAAAHGGGEYMRDWLETLDETVYAV